MSTPRKLFHKPHLGPFIFGGLLYAIVLGSCDYNYWGDWVLSLHDFLEFPFMTLVDFASRHSSSPESNRWGFLFFAAVLMNAHLYGFMLSLISSLFILWRKSEPNQPLEPTPISVTPAANAPVAPDTGVAHL